MAQLVKALRSHRRDPWFESRCAHFSFSYVQIRQSLFLTSFSVFRPVKKSMRCCSTFPLLLLAGGLVAAWAIPDTLCVTVESPKQGAVISAPSCTVAVKVCDQIAAITFIAKYSLQDLGRDTSFVLGHITHPPFTLIWNTNAAPNQLGSGMSFLIVALFKSGERLFLQQDHIYLANKPVLSPVASIPYADGNGLLLYTKTLTAGRTPLTVHVSMGQTSEGIRLYAKASGDSFFTSLQKENLSTMGIEVCIDPSLSRKPFMPSNAFSISVPLEGVPFVTKNRPVFLPNDSFDIIASREPCSCSYKINKKDVNGFDISVMVPNKLFGPSLPNSFGCNVIVRVSDENNQIINISWIDAPQAAFLSPFLWGTVKLLPKPFLNSLWVLWFISFGAGLIVSILGGFFYFLMKKRSVSFENFEQTEEEKNQSEKIYQLISENISKKDLTLQWIAEKLKLPPKKVANLLKKNKGKSFKDYAMSLRIEIVKERLRSSHSSETFIATSCGFKNVSEMEKYFSKFQRTTPFKYRKENQVA
jgi:AraC-like DNA-binding protein